MLNTNLTTNIFLKFSSFYNNNLLRKVKNFCQLGILTSKMEEKIFSNNSSIESMFNDSLQEDSELRKQVAQLTNQNEEYQQSIHVLRLELQRKNAMFEEAKNIIEESSVEKAQNFKDSIQKLTNQSNEERKNFQTTIKQLEENLILKEDENKDLNDQISTLKRQLNSQEKLPTIQEETIIEESTELNGRKVNELIITLEERDKNFIELEKISSHYQNDNIELREIIQSYKVSIQEKDQIIKNTQEELAECRLELTTIKTTTVVDSHKGNSLFAEVENRRQDMMEKMKSMRDSYREMRKSFASKENEIKTLKMELATLLRNCEDNAIESVEQEAALVEAYTTRISDLENRLKEEQKKNKQFQKEQQTGSNMNYLQTLLNSRKKEIEELQTQLENNSIRTLLKEEISYKLKNRLRYWKYKAMALEANFTAIQSQLQVDPNCSTAEILHLIKSQISNKSIKANADIEDEPELSLKPEIVDETSVSLESLIRPKPLLKPNLECNLSTDMSLTNVVDNSCLEGDTTILANHSVKPLINVCKTLNFTMDMSMTQPIEAENNSNLGSLKAEIEDEDITSFEPVSTSSCIENVQQNMEHVSLTSNQSNKENIEVAGNSSILKSALSLKRPNEQKEKKVLRFTTDTIEPQEGYIRRLKEKQMKYPIVFISSESHK